MPAPTTSITLYQDRTSDGTTYTVENSITAYANMPDDGCFVYKLLGATFDHVATPIDVITYPSGATEQAAKDAASAQSLGFYRWKEATQDFATVQEAQDFADTVKSRIKSLASEYQMVANTFVGNDTTTYTS